MERIPALLGITGVCLVLKRIVQCLELGLVNSRNLRLSQTGVGLRQGIMSGIDLLLSCLVVGKHLGGLIERGLERVPGILGVAVVSLVLKRIVQCLKLGLVNLRDFGLFTVDVVEVDLADGEHVVVGILEGGSGTGRSQRLDLHLGDLLSLIRIGDGENILLLVLSVVAALELLLGAILERDHRLDAVDGAIGGHCSIEELNVRKGPRLLEFEGDVRRQADFLVVGLVFVIPLELECAIGVVVVEQAVIAILLDELLHIGAVVGRVPLVGDRDVKGILTKLLRLRGLRLLALNIVEVDLAQRQHAILRGIALVASNGALGGERRDLDTLDLLALLGSEGIDGLLLGELAVLEFGLGTVGVGDDGLHGGHGAVVGVTVDDLDVAQRAGLVELEAHRGGQHHVLGELAILLVASDIPLELEAVIGLVVVEQAVVVVALDELLDVGAVVGGQLLIGHRDLEGILTELLDLRTKIDSIGLNHILLGADEPGLRLKSDLCILLSLELEGHDILATAIQGLIALVRQRDVHGILLITKGVVTGEILHLARLAHNLKAIVHEFEVGNREPHQGTHGVHILSTLDLQRDLDGFTRLHLVLGRNNSGRASDFARLLGAPIESGHGPAHIVDIVGIVHIEVGTRRRNMGIPIGNAATAVLAAFAVAGEMGVIIVQNLRRALDRPRKMAGRAILLVDGDLRSREEVTSGGKRS